MKIIEEKILNNEFEKLSLKEIDNYIEDNWLLWTMKFNLSPMGHLTLKGKQTYIDGYSEEIKELIKLKQGWGEE